MLNPTDATYCYIDRVIRDTANAVLVDNGTAQEWLPLNATLIFELDNRLIQAVPQWAMDDKPSYNGCKKFESDSPYWELESKARLLKYWIIPEVMRPKKVRY